MKTVENKIMKFYVALILTATKYKHNFFTFGNVWIMKYMENMFKIWVLQVFGLTKLYKK